MISDIHIILNLGNNIFEIYKSTILITINLINICAARQIGINRYDIFGLHSKLAMILYCLL